MPTEQAEVQAEVLTEAFNVNLDALVTKDYLAARFAELNASIATRFAEQNASIDSRFADFDARFKVHTVMHGIVVAAVVLPLLERLAAL